LSVTVTSGPFRSACTKCSEPLLVYNVVPTM
jgi:hypothetical protein